MAKKKIDYSLAKKVAGTSALKEQIIKTDSKKIENIPLKKLHVNPYQPRIHIDNGELQELADSIKENGLMQPIIVTTEDHDTYTIIAGHRRFGAYKLLNKNTIDAIVLPKVAHEQLAIFPLVENLQRADMDPIENAIAFDRLLKEDIVQNQGNLAKMIGVSKSWMSRMLSILKLPKELIAEVKDTQYTDVHVLSALNKLDPKVSKEVFLIIKDKSRSDATSYIKNHIEDIQKKELISPIKINKNSVIINLKDLDEQQRIKVQKMIEKIQKIL